MDCPLSFVLFALSKCGWLLPRVLLGLMPRPALAWGNRYLKICMILRCKRLVHRSLATASELCYDRVTEYTIMCPPSAVRLVGDGLFS
jgi:hypothetical protein